MEKYCIYLRKSRADAEAEARGEGETLTRHRKMLTELAAKNGLNVVEIYEEIVSGDSISARPQMQALLAKVSQKTFAGVLVAEVERLARGDTIDQGIVARTFKESSTKIITPTKTYDPENEFDEEYFEFSLFMSRREYKTINRRMQAGRLASVKEGNYIGTCAPYGYRKISPEPKIHTLKIVPEEAEVVQFIFQSFLNGHGAKFIAAKLNKMGISPRKSRVWEYTSVRKILSNPVYCGKISWKTKSNGNILYHGLHEPIISEDTFNAAIIKRNSVPAPRVKSGVKLRNYYHNVLICQNCGHQIKRRKVTGSDREHLLCMSSQCSGIIVSSPMEIVDLASLSALRYFLQFISELKTEIHSENVTKSEICYAVQAELQKLDNQLSRLQDFLEQGIYDVQLYLKRSEIVKQRIDSVQKTLNEIEQKEPKQFPKSISITLRNIVENFPQASPDEKNRLFIAVFREIQYSKRKPHSAISLNAALR